MGGFKMNKALYRMIFSIVILVIICMIFSMADNIATLQEILEDEPEEPFIDRTSPIMSDQDLFEQPYDPLDFHATAIKMRAFAKKYREYSKTKNHRLLQPISQMTKHLFPWIRSEWHESIMALTESYKGKGIVICSGNHYFPFTLFAVNTIRKTHKCNLPIEIFYIGNGDLTKNNRELLEQIDGVTCRDVYDSVSQDILNLGGWSIKPFALLASSFDEVILLDADAVFLQSPEVLFSFPGYQETGALFFHDRTLFQNSKENVEWVDTMLLTPRREYISNLRYFQRNSAHEMESGAMAIKKSARILGLLAACWMNGKQERDQVTYRHMYGDKETYWIGFEAVQEPFVFEDLLPGNIGVPDDEYTICGTQMTHTDWKGQPLWFNNGLIVSKFDRTTEPAVFTHFVVEPGKWVLHEGNRACLTGDEKVKELSPEMKNVVQQNKEIWTTVAKPLL